MCFMQLVNNLQLPPVLTDAVEKAMWKRLPSIGERRDKSIRAVSFSCEGSGCISKTILPLPEQVKRKIRRATCIEIKCVRSSVF